MKLTKFLKFLEWGTYTVCVFIISFVLISLLMPKVLDVHEMWELRKTLKGSIGVVGKVEGYNKNTFFVLVDCGKRNVCTAIVTDYKGQKPKAGSEIIAYGRLIEVNKTLKPYIISKGGRHTWEYILQADKINMKDSDFKGKIFYSIGQVLRPIRKAFTKKGSIEFIIEFRNWLYLKCEKCSIIKKRIIPTSLFPSA